MTYVNVGAYVNGRRPASKKALREALRDNPASVVFDATSPLGPDVSGLVGTDIPAGFSLSVVGPDPYVTRNWYATVTRKSDGTAKLA